MLRAPDARRQRDRAVRGPGAAKLKIVRPGRGRTIVQGAGRLSPTAKRAYTAAEQRTVLIIKQFMIKP